MTRIVRDGVTESDSDTGIHATECLWGSPAGRVEIPCRREVASLRPVEDRSGGLPELHGVPVGIGKGREPPVGIDGRVDVDLESRRPELGGHRVEVVDPEVDAPPRGPTGVTPSPSAPNGGETVGPSVWHHTSAS